MYSSKKSNITGGSCVVNVGLGGIDLTTVGGDSIITVAAIDRYRAKGGGSSANGTQNGNNGGCGGCGGV